MTSDEHVGEPGTPGVEGAPGDPAGPGGDGGKGGKGGVGMQGETGAAGGWSDKAMAFLVAVLTAVFAFLFVRVAINQHEIEQANYESCLGGQQVVQHFDELLDGLIRIERSNPNQGLATARIGIYTAGMIPVPDCGSSPTE